MKARLGIFGVTGWKNSGKTRMVANLVSEFTGRGLKVSTVKHAHHTFDVDQEGRDSWQHRQAGACEVALVSRNRWALMHELRGEEEPSLDEILERLLVSYRRKLGVDRLVPQLTEVHLVN